MKVGPLTQILEIYNKKNVSNRSGKDSEKKDFDKVSISDEAYQKLQNNPKEQIKDLKDIDMGMVLDQVITVDNDKVNNLKKQIESGEYTIDYNLIASKMIEE